MKTPSITELAAVTAVGVGLAFAAKKVGIAEKAPLLAPALLYTLGFYIATKRPEGGYAQLSKSAS
jgi:hypothetical protein